MRFEKIGLTQKRILEQSIKQSSKIASYTQKISRRYPFLYLFISVLTFHQHKSLQKINQKIQTSI